MSSHIRKYISIACVALISLCLPVGAFGADDSSHARPRPEFTAEIKTLLASLDSLLAEAPRLDRAKQERIERNRRNYKAATDPDRRYWTASELYDEYCSYDSDSAMFYAERALDYARLMGRNDFIYDMELNRCYLFSATGMLAEADNCLSAVPPDSVPLRMATKYFERLLFLYNHRDQYTGVARDKDASARTLDSLVTEMRANLRPNSTDYGLMLGWSCLNLGADIPSSIPQLKRIVDSSPLTSRSDAVNASMLAKLYDRTGDDTNHLKYLIISAMADIRACNKEIMSLEEVAGILNDHGDLDRANSYINYCIAAANDYKSRVRLDQLSKTQGEILDSIHSRSERQESANRRYLAILIAILCVLVLATIYIMRQNRLLRRSRSTLNDANAELNSRVSELQSIREKLDIANSRLSSQYEDARQNVHDLSEDTNSKEAYIAEAFTICSDYIDRQDEFRSLIKKLINDNKTAQAVRILQSPEHAYEDLRDLYARFDALFLGLHPDFVENFNALLRPEERIELKDPMQLTTELRVHALVRLGMDDNAKIAKFMHCSIQTVYNTRQRARKKSTVARNEFVDAVKALGRLD